MSKTIAGYRKGRPPKYQVDWTNVAVGQEVHIPVQNGNTRRIQSALYSMAIRHGMIVSCSTTKLLGFVSMLRIK